MRRREKDWQKATGFIVFSPLEVFVSRLWAGSPCRSNRLAGTDLAGTIMPDGTTR
jgi:hypothetical protein